MKCFAYFLPLLLFSILCGGSIFSSASETEDEIVDSIDEDLKDGQVIDDVASETIEEPTAPEDTGSSNAEITLYFTKPAYRQVIGGIDLPAGKQVNLLVGFVNKGSVNFIIEKLSGSLRYPLELNYVIQNFSTSVYNKEVAPGHHATFSYSFVPADSLASRSFGFQLELSYIDEFGKQFGQKLYNETVTIVEEDEGLDGETFFLYIFLGAGLVLLLVIGQHFLYSYGKKHVGSGSAKKQSVQVETGTKKSNDIDYDFIPKHLLNNIKGPKVSRQYPKQRKIK